jgi:hypothetical protein
LPQVARHHPDSRVSARFLSCLTPAGLFF